MKVLALTIFVGLILVGFFVLLWIAAACDPRQFNERDALLPLDDDVTPASGRCSAPPPSPAHLTGETPVSRS
jgi:hypothetical protein